MNETESPYNEIRRVVLTLHVFANEERQVQYWERDETPLEGIDLAPSYRPLLMSVPSYKSGQHRTAAFSLERIEHGTAYYYPYSTLVGEGLPACLPDKGFQRVDLCLPLPKSIAAMQQSVSAWEAQQFPDTTNLRRHRHLMREVEELRKTLIEWFALQAHKSPNVVWPSVLHEFAGMFLLLCSICEGRNISLAEVIAAEFQTVQGRAYANADAEGVVEHTRDREVL